MIGSLQAQENPYLDSLRNRLPFVETPDDSIRVLCQMAWNIADENPEETKRYGLLALRTSKHCNDSILIADAQDAAAMGFRYTGDLEKAKYLYTQSLQIGLRNKIKSRCAWGYFHLAEIAMREGDFQQVEAYAWKSFHYFHGIDDFSNATNSLYLAQKVTSRYTDTLVGYISYRMGHDKDENTRLFYYLQLANLYNLQENRNQAMHYVQLAMELADKNQNSKGILKAYYQIANYFTDYQKDYETALKYYTKILEMNQAKNPNDLGDPLIRIGEMHRLMGNDSLALHYFTRGLEEGKRNKHRHTMATSFMQLGDLNYHRHNYQEALFYYLKCYETGCDICPQIRFHDALVNIGNVYALEYDEKNALAYYDKSLVLAESADDDRARIQTYQAYANLYEKQGNISQATDYFNQAYQLAHQTSFLEGQQYNAARLSNIYRKDNQFALAYEFLSIANHLSDSIREISEADNLAKLETYFDYQNLKNQKNLEQARSEEEIRRQKLIRNFFILAFVLMGVSGYLIYRGYRIKKKDNVLLQEQKRSIKAMSEKIHEADQAKLQFYTNVSHELRTPLTLILGMTEKLKSSLKENQQLGLIRKNSYKLLHLINHLLDLRKLDASKMSLGIQSGSINEFLKGIISSFEEYARQKKITIEFEQDKHEVTSYFDHDKMEKIVSNLLSNAIKYTESGGWVRVRTERSENGFLKIEVRDNGIGIPESDIKNIFKRFYRVTANDNNGSGIGLALVKELVELHKGEISVDTLKGEGTSLTVTIPIDRHFYSENEVAEKDEKIESWNYVEALEAEMEIPETGDEVRSNPEKQSILIVEDNTDLRKFISEMFRDLFDVLEAENGLVGLRLACEYVPDIIISDVLMPKMSGIQLVEKIKSIATTSHIPVILLTAKDDLGTRLSGFEKGADDYICKPFESVVLKSRVENLLRLRKQLVEKFSNQFHLQPREIFIEDAEQKFLQKTIEVIEAHIADTNLNIDLLAMELGISRTQLYRKLKALTDYSANQFIRIIRIKRAAQILQQGQNNIAEVMDATGFSNYSYFNNCFKEYFGEYPKDYALLSVKGSLN